MSRVTAPVSKLSRALSSSATSAAARTANPLLDSSAHGSGAMLMPKYAELLRTRRSSEHTDSSRHMTTAAHRPISLANRPKPLMQTFHSSPASSAMHTSGTHLDATIIPNMSELAGESKPAPSLRVPLLPDNYGAAYEAVDTEAPAPGVTIVASDPDQVVPGAPLSGVEGISLDGIELKFAHDSQGQEVAHNESSKGMIRDIWKGMVEDVFGGPRKAA